MLNIHKLSKKEFNDFSNRVRDGITHSSFKLCLIGNGTFSKNVYETPDVTRFFTEIIKNNQSDIKTISALNNLFIDEGMNIVEVLPFDKVENHLGLDDSIIHVLTKQPFRNKFAFTDCMVILDYIEDIHVLTIRTSNTMMDTDYSTNLIPSGKRLPKFTCEIIVP